MSGNQDIFDETMGRFESWVVRRVLNNWEHSTLEVELNQSELLDELKAISRAGIIKGAIAGAVSGLVSLLCFWMAADMYPMEHFSWESWPLALRHYGIELGGSILATVLEIAYLYYIAAESAQKMLALTQERELIKDKDIAKTLGLAMIRAGFESPNSREIRLNIDPLLHASRWKLFVSGLLYKTKILISKEPCRMPFLRILAAANQPGASCSLHGTPIFAEF